MQFGMLTFDEPQPDISRKILHVDMDAFYASIEMRDNPSIKNKPVVIAKHPNMTGGRGIVATCNYIARQYGIHSAMPAVEAYRRCPQAVFVPGRHAHYRAVSDQIHQIFRSFTDVIEPVALDEAYLDITDNKMHIPSGTIIAQMIQQAIYEETRLTCSVGVSYNKFLAKLASDYKKPAGITVIEPTDAQNFLLELPIDKFHGIGEKSLPHFHALGIHKGSDLINQSLDKLVAEFGKMGYSLYFKVRGIHNAPVNATRERKSIGSETTFSQFLNTESEVLFNFERLTTKIVKKLREKNLLAYTVTIKIRYEDFETITRQIKADEAFDDENSALELVQLLWQEHGHLNKSIRLIGVSLSNFDDQEVQLIPLLDPDDN